MLESALAFLEYGALGVLALLLILQYLERRDVRRRLSTTLDKLTVVVEGLKVLIKERLPRQ